MSFDLLLEMAWKTGLVAGVVLIGAGLLRSRPAAERVAVLRLGVVMVLALPLLAALMPAVRVQAPALAAPERAAPAAAGVLPAPPPVGAVAPSRIIRALPTRPTTARPAWRIDPVTAALAIWIAGFGFLALRLFAGVALLSRWTHRAEPVADARWLAALDRASQGRKPPVLRASARVTSPLSWGWRPAIILLDSAALDHAGRADAVLAHEMGHVRHGDWTFLMLSRVAVAAFWFNPLVWLLQRELARQSEQAADAWAAGRIGRADYASALVAMAARGRPHAALGMAAPKGELARRVIAIMTASRSRGAPWRAVLSIAACLGFATPLAAVELAPGTLAEVSPSAPHPSPIKVRASSPSEVAAAAFAPPPARPDDPPVPPGQLATALRQRDQGLTVMEAGARTLEAQAREMRRIAAGMDEERRAALLDDANELMDEAAALRAEARELAARDPATLRPMSPEEERELFASMEEVLASPGPLDGDKAGDEVMIEPGGAYHTPGVRGDTSGAVRTASGLQINASGAVRTSNGFQINASGEMRTDTVVTMPVEVRVPVETPAGPAPADIQAHQSRERIAAIAGMREGARQMLQGAAEMEAGADDIQRIIAERPTSPTAREGPARMAQMRRQAEDIRRQAAEMSLRADQAEAAG